MGHYERGEWRPYGHDELVDLLAGCLERTPSYCRLTRVIRDFSSHDIVAGNQVTNLREVAEDRLRGRGGVCRDIRAREIREIGIFGRGIAAERPGVSHLDRRQNTSWSSCDSGGSPRRAFCASRCQMRH